MNLESERIYLRKLEELDAPIMLANTMDEEIRYMTGTKPNFTLEQIQTHINSINNDPSRYDFAICLKEDGQMIGELSISDIDEENKKAGWIPALSKQEDLEQADAPAHLKPSGNLLTVFGFWRS